MKELSISLFDLTVLAGNAGRGGVTFEELERIECKISISDSDREKLLNAIIQARAETEVVMHKCKLQSSVEELQVFQRIVVLLDG